MEVKVKNSSFKGHKKAATFFFALIFVLLSFFLSPFQGLSQQKEIAKDKYSKTTLEILESIEKERMVLLKKEEDIKKEKKILKDIKDDVDKRIAKLKTLRLELEGLLEKLEKRDEEKFRHLVKVYEGMRPEEAGPLISTLREDIAIRIFSGMNNKKAAKILPFIEPEKAIKISEAMIKKRKK
ncbi:MAG TPA: hypothetical protein VMW81_09910 [Nitrospinota bacterium]|nr:hypothetical protein [Nitrospinota bacterium]